MKTEELIPTGTEQKALAAISPIESELLALVAESEAITITDKASLDRAVDVTKRMKKFETTADKTRVSIFKPIRDIMDMAKKNVDGWISTSQEKRKALEDKINAEEIRIQNELRAEHIRRVNLLQASGWTLAGEFYVCGVNRIFFADIDAAEPEMVNTWVMQGESEKKRVEAARAAQDAKDKELAEREAKLRAMEAEMEEFRQWKAAQEAAKVAPAVEAVILPKTAQEIESALNANAGALSANAGALSALQPDTKMWNPESPIFNVPATPALNQVGEDGIAPSNPLPLTEYDCGWNEAVDAIVDLFLSGAPRKREDWAADFRSMKK